MNLQLSHLFPISKGQETHLPSEKRVNFWEVHIQEYEVIASDNPSVELGAGLEVCLVFAIFCSYFTILLRSKSYHFMLWGITLQINIDQID